MTQFHVAVEAAKRHALQMLDLSLSVLDRRPLQQATKDLMWELFRQKEPQELSRMLRALYHTLDTIPINTAPADDPECALLGVGGYADRPHQAIQLCAGFLDDPVEYSAYFLLHEATHLTPGLVSQDIASSGRRLLTFLPPELAQRNADTYTVFVVALWSAFVQGLCGSIYDLPLQEDILRQKQHISSGFVGDENAAANASIAWLESWLYRSTSAVDKVRSLFSRYKKNNDLWLPATSAYDGYVFPIELLAQAFQLPIVIHVQQKKYTYDLAQVSLDALQDIRDSFLELERVLTHRRTLALRNHSGETSYSTSGEVFWERAQIDVVHFDAAFFQRTTREQVRFLLHALITAYRDIISPSYPMQQYAQFIEHYAASEFQGYP